MVFGVLVHDAAARPSRARLVAIALCVAVGVLTHYLFVLPLVAALIWLGVGSYAPRKIRVRVGAAAVIGLLAIVPWAGVLAEQYSAERFGWIDDFDPLKGLYLYGTIFDVGGPLYSTIEPTTLGFRQLLWLAVLPLVVAGAVALWRRGDEGRLYALMALVPFVAAYLIWAAGPEIFNTRNLLALAPFAVIAIAALVAVLPRPAGIVAGAALVLASTAATIAAPPVAPPADRIAQTLVEQGWNGDDSIVLIADFYGFRSPIGWYLPGKPFLYRVGLDGSGGRVFLVVQGRRSWEALGGLRPRSGAKDLGGIFVVPLESGAPQLETLVALGGKIVRPRAA
jgi:hypothetical protein